MTKPLHEESVIAAANKRRRKRRPDFSPIGSPEREEETAGVFRLHGLPDPVFRHKFYPLRDWTLDIAWPEHKVYIEVVKVGQTMSKSRAVQNMAVGMGWRPIVLLSGAVRDRATCAKVKGLMRRD